ncbi:NADP oxidoreductase [Actinoplanes lobatus]|uniref:NADP oxidoreductase n=1 Tax=Actinoplanes lobatus TaxID=113568 RepID=A0A7W7HJK5_9ACTN|nr:NAD(P)-binding domain-containing protein [Actinoplanes lobatus]MBB4751722.1 putative dinucleotide-binding enzyme [Actinoplanes lobatus]GGN65432.1 NADP oxidoreductase [Actinoplanes lobatus]GIE43305.1 NADP oxidoreductase [Actinoplanes lobatus]
MRIGILGTGGMAAALGSAWTAAGHHVMIGGRDRVRARQTAERISASGHGTLTDAAGHGDAVLVAIPAAQAPAVVGGLAEHLAGRTVVDCTNPLAPTGEGLMLATSDGTSLAGRLAMAAPGAHVVKAFNMCHVSIWSMRPPVFEDVALSVPYCADHPTAIVVTQTLISSIGCTPAPCGGLARAGYLEATAAFAIGLWFAGGQPRAVFPSPAESPQP